MVAPSGLALSTATVSGPSIGTTRTIFTSKEPVLPRQAGSSTRMLTGRVSCGRRVVVGVRDRVTCLVRILL